MTESPRLEELRRRVNADPASIAFAALAEEFRRAGRFREAVDTSRAGLRHHPTYVSARVTLGRSLVELQEFEQAEREFAFVLRSAPDNLAARRALGELCWQRLRFADALGHFQAALALAPNDTELPGVINALERELESERAAAAAAAVPEVAASDAATAEGAASEGVTSEVVTSEVVTYGAASPGAAVLEVVQSGASASTASTTYEASPADGAVGYAPASSSIDASIGEEGEEGKSADNVYAAERAAFVEAVEVPEGSDGFVLHAGAVEAFGGDAHAPGHGAALGDPGLGDTGFSDAALGDAALGEGAALTGDGVLGGGMDFGVGADQAVSGAAAAYGAPIAAARGSKAISSLERFYRAIVRARTARDASESPRATHVGGA